MAAWPSDGCLEFVKRLEVGHTYEIHIGRVTTWREGGREGGRERVAHLKVNSPISCKFVDHIVLQHSVAVPNPLSSQHVNCLDR